MRAAALLLAAVVGLSGCATVAEGATVVTGGAAASPSATSPSLPTPSLPTPSLPTPSLPTPSNAGPSGPPIESPGPSGQASASETADPSPAASPSMEPTPSTPTPVSDPAPAGSYVLGDSISLSVAPLLSRYGYPVTGRVGQSAYSTFLEQYLSRPDAQAAPGWVIVLGTNNRGDAADVARLPEWIDLVAGLRTRGAKQQVYWVTPHRPAAYPGGLSRFSLQDFNAELGRLAGERRWLHVLDFDALAASHPEWFADDAGRLHPNRDGQAALAELIAGPDAATVARAATITTLEWPTPTPTPAPEPGEDQTFDNSAG